MEKCNQYETQFISFLFSLHERPGCYIAYPSLEKLLNFMVGYEVAVYNLTGYQIVLEQEFRRYLCKKYKKDELNCSLFQLFRQDVTDEEAFENFFVELRNFCEKTK